MDVGPPMDGSRALLAICGPIRKSWERFARRSIVSHLNLRRLYGSLLSRFL